MDAMTPVGRGWSAALPQGVEGPSCIPDGIRVMSSSHVHELGCPGPWVDNLVSSTGSERKAPRVLIDVGANKGYMIAEFLSLWRPQNSTPSAAAWNRAIRQWAAEHGSHALRQRSCGECGDCKRKAQPPAQRSLSWPGTSFSDDVVVHALELVEDNRHLLRSIIDRFGLSASVQVHNLAASNETRTMFLPRRYAAGAEKAELLQGQSAANANTSVAVSVVDLDSFIASQGLGLHSIYQITVDTEGHDPLVLEGLRRTIQRRAVTLLQFEVGKKGYWNKAHPERRRLNVTAAWLHAAGYECFFETHSALVPFSGPCWQPHYDGTASRKWANVLCTHEPSMAQQLYSMAWAAYHVRTANINATRGLRGTHGTSRGAAAAPRGRA